MKIRTMRSGIGALGDYDSDTRRPGSNSEQEEPEAMFWFRGIARFCHVQRSWSPSELVFRQNVSVAIP